MTTAVARYAIYFAPEAESALWRFGSGVIGYDAARGAAVPSVAVAGLDAADWAKSTEEPRRYGFHATLKAPFELAGAHDEASLLAAVERLAGVMAPVAIGRLCVRSIGRFIALIPATPTEALQAFASRVVTDLEPFRGALAEADRARRLKSQLTARQIANLDRFGYPHVHEDFRFHMTLTGPILDEALRQRVRDDLEARFEREVTAGAVTIDTLGVFHQPSRDAPFRIIARMPLLRRPDVAKHP